MTNPEDWERQLKQELSDIRRSGHRLNAAMAVVRGRGEVRGITIEVSAAGDITNLQIAPGVMRWPSTQLTASLLDCHRRARIDAAAKAERVLRAVDPRIRNQLNELRDVSETEGSTAPQRPRTEEEIQAADDAYYQRINGLDGWT
ncbi:hypothetical protein [Nocardia sp. NPDC051570]|uniref:hypothetical protein n=1 Tax=Nocardia sp. NPDC051570 TaxID=3364324 RepID=UPI00378A9FD5